MSDPEKQETNQQPDNSGNMPLPDTPGSGTNNGVKSEKGTDKAEYIKGNSTDHRFLGLKPYEIANVILLVLLVFVNYQYTVYAGKQWTTMESQLRTYYAQLLVSRDTLNQMKSAGDQSAHQTDRIIEHANHIANSMDIGNSRNRDSYRNSLNETEKELGFNIDNARQEQRAWLGMGTFAITQFTKDKGLTVTVNMFNSGKTPALLVTMAGRVDYSPQKPTGPSQQDIKNFVFVPSQSVPPQGTFTHRMEVPKENLSDNYDALQKRTEWLYLFGEFHYTDVSHTFSGDTQYCLFLNIPEGAAPELLYCPEFNDIK